MATHSSTLAWKIPWTQSTGSQRVRHDWATSLSRTGEENSNPLQCSCLENPRDGGAWWAAVYGAAQSRTRLKRLSSSSSSSSSFTRRRQWHPTPVLLPGKSQGRRSLVGCSPWGRWGSGTTSLSLSLSEVFLFKVDAQYLFIWKFYSILTNPGTYLL